MSGADRETTWTRFMTSLMGYLRSRDVNVRRESPVSGGGAVRPRWNEDGLTLACILDFSQIDAESPTLTVLDDLLLREEDLKRCEARQTPDSERAGGRTHFIVRYPDIPAATTVFTPSIGEDVFQRLERRRAHTHVKGAKGRPGHVARGRGAVPAAAAGPDGAAAPEPAASEVEVPE